MRYKSIAIDGPAGSGKGTIAKNIANILNYKYVDTGAMYRTVALKVVQCGLSTKVKEDVVSILDKLDMKIQFNELGQVNLLDGINVNDKIRTQEMSQGSSDVAVFQEVRIKLVEIQRELAKNENIIMEGRDITTNVLPNADVKIFLTASVEERAKRRHKELNNKGVNITLDEVIRTIEERDKQDSGRAYAPLSIAEDAVVVDSTNLNIDEVTKKVLDIVKGKIFND